MAYEEPIIGWSDEDSEEDENGRLDSIGGTVVADTTAEAYQALTELGIVVGEEYEAYPGKPCVRRRVSRPDGPSTLRRWSAQFQGSNDETEGSTDPANRPVYVEWREGKEVLSTTYDVNGEPLLSTSAEFLDPRTQDVDTFFITIYQWAPQYDPRKRIRFSNTCNSDTVTFLGIVFQPGELALRSYIPTGRIQYRPNGSQVPPLIEEMYVLEARGALKNGAFEDILDNGVATGFYDRKADVGLHGWYMDSSGNSQKGKIYTKSDDGQFTPISSPIPLRNGLPIDPENVYYVGKTKSDKWLEVPPEPDVVYDDSRPRVSYILTPRLVPVPYATVRD